MDTTSPQLALNGGGSFCPRCGDILALSYDVQDALSGISGWTLSASGAVIASNTIAETSVVDWDGSGLGGGTHTLTLSVRDAAGNTAETSISITLNTPRPEPTQTRLTILPTRTPTPRPVVPLIGPAEPGLEQKQPFLFTFISEPPDTRGFSISPENPSASAELVSTQTTASPVLWGGAAAGLIGAAMVVAMEAQRKRKEEEARQIAEMHRLNAEMRAREKQEALLIAQRRETAALLAAMAAEGAAQAKLEDEEQAWLEKKMARDEAMFGQGTGTTNNDGQSGLAALAAATGAARVQKEYEEPNSGKGAGLARVVPYDKQLDDKPPDPWYIKILKEIVFAISGLYGGYLSTLDPKNFNKTVGSSSLQPQKIITPTLNLTPTNTIESTPTVTPTPAFMQMRVLADALKLREQPSVFSEPYLRLISKGEIILVAPNASPAYNDGFKWLPVTYHDPTINSRAIAASPQFLNPLSNFVRTAVQGEPIIYANHVSGWEEKHIGNDFVPYPNTDPNPPVIASAE